MSRGFTWSATYIIFGSFSFTYSALVASNSIKHRKQVQTAILKKRAPTNKCEININESNDKYALP